MKGETTVLTRATSKSESLRTTLPAGIARQFRLGEGDKLEWEIKPRKNKLVIEVMPVSTGKKGEGV